MANKGPFLDPETGLKRQREQRPDGLGTKYEIKKFGPWEIYHCRFEGCVYDTQWSEQFDVHYYQKHEIPIAQAQAMQEAAVRARERAQRIKDWADIPILRQ